MLKHIRFSVERSARPDDIDIFLQCSAHQLARRERELAKILKLSDGIDLEAVQIGKQ